MATKRTSRARREPTTRGQIYAEVVKATQAGTRIDWRIRVHEARIERLRLTGRSREAERMDDYPFRRVSCLLKHLEALDHAWSQVELDTRNF